MLGLIQQQTKDKSHLIEITSPIGLAASLIIAECILRSDWGTKPPAKKENNLFLLEADEFYKGKTIAFEGKNYRIYDSWLDFFIDYSDFIVFSNKYEKVLLAGRVDLQLDLLVNIKGYSSKICAKLEEIITKYGLWEFDLFS